MNKLLLFSTEITNRLAYSANLLFADLLGLDVRLTADEFLFQKSLLPKINYSKNKVADVEFQITPHTLLFEQTIENQLISVESFNDFPIFFKTGNSEFSFDLLAASFYLVSRYEEYLPFEPDAHGRFSATQSLSFRYDFLEKPLVNQWANYFGECLVRKFSDLKISKPAFKFQLTYDIDYAFLYQQKGFFRTIGSTLKSVLKFDFTAAKNRLKIACGFAPDPYFNVDFQAEIHAQFQLAPIYFFHVGDYLGEPDAPIDFRRRAMRDLIRKISEKSIVGLHPSYRASTDFEWLKTEKKRLENILEKPVLHSRQHFLRLRFPETYRALIEAGIEADFTMSYADKIGFRASIAHSFLWFDLIKNESTDLRIYPFQIMDVTLHNYLQLSPNEAIDASTKLIEKVQKTGGICTILWHNSSLSEIENWIGWRRVFIEIIKRAITN